MKTKNLVFALFIMGTFVFLNSCGSGSSISPSGTIKEFATKVEKGDIDGAIGCIATEGKTVDKETKGKLTLILGMGKGQMEKKQGIKNMEVLNEQVDADGKTATVKMKFTYGDGSTDEEDYTLLKEDGKWKISMTKK
ncbi:MAG: DUF4878 domain-containing protein [Bacteroidetes bacterium]|nr:DUF4878 domain-containing protein [Bacteroidota bacterium]